VTTSLSPLSYRLNSGLSDFFRYKQILKHIMGTPLITDGRVNLTTEADTRLECKQFLIKSIIVSGLVPEILSIKILSVNRFFGVLTAKTFTDRGQNQIASRYWFVSSYN
jgi:hypothetical protein